jgi:hypothetical protein
MKKNVDTERSSCLHFFKMNGEKWKFVHLPTDIDQAKKLPKQKNKQEYASKRD